MVDIYVDNHTQQDFQVDIRDCAGVGSIKNGPVNRGTTDSWRFTVHDGSLQIGSNIYRVNVSAIGEGANPRNNFWFGLSTDWKGGCDVRIVLTPYGPVGTTTVDYVLRYTPDSLPS